MATSTKRGKSNALMQIAGIGVLVAVALGVLALLPQSWLFTKETTQAPAPANETERYAGEIRMEPSRDGRCRVIAFDNRSEKYWDKGLMPCETAPSALDQSGRFDSISKSFKRQ